MRPRNSVRRSPFFSATPCQAIGCKVLLTAAVLLALAITALGGPSPASAQEPRQWVADELLVGIRPGLSHAKARAMYEAHGGALIQEIPQIQTHRIRVPAHALEAIQRVLSRRPEVKFVEKNEVFPPDFTPNDPYYPYQWHLPKILADEAWDITQGSPGIIVAVLDTGVDPTHPDLKENLVAGYNFYDLNTDTSDVYGHGTAVAGAASAQGNNRIGVASVAWHVRVMPVRIASPDGYAYTSTIAQGLTWAADHGARVMNVSFSGVAGSSTIRTAAQYVQNRGGVVVAAAGNCACLDATPENPYILSVSATDQNDYLASFSSRGEYVDVSAPGVSIASTTNGGGYGSVSGTSFASPITAGVAALMLSVNGNLAPGEIERLLESTAIDLGTAGYDTSFGFGRVNAKQAVQAAGNYNPVPDTTPPSASISSPANGDVVTGTITVTVSASDDVAVVNVQLYLDGQLFANDTTGPFSFAWDTTQSTNGSHTLQAKAYDGAGNSSLSSPVYVTAENTDVILPEVSITSPVNGSTVTKTVKIGVRASDAGKVQQVQVFIDGFLLSSMNCGSITCAYQVSWNTRLYSKNWHFLTATASDAAGNSGTSKEVWVRVK
jgi:thermitase